MAFILFLAFSLVLQGALGEVLKCEDIPVTLCSLSVSSSGKRCLLETGVQTGEALRCRNSGVLVDGIREHIETDECVEACGADRYAVGISSDSLLVPQFTAKLCSPSCLQNCPNVVDLYSNLALAEGMVLPDLCESQVTGQRRAMAEIRSSGTATAPCSGFPFGHIFAPAYSPTASSIPSIHPDTY